MIKSKLLHINTHAIQMVIESLKISYTFEHLVSLFIFDLNFAALQGIMD